ncbi:hypothetical protein O6H91_07G040200 [Diphasiastrum complanatum]|uniref:Uncharacterized protein n=1 Tax=Diphasiastrum complanatum TaxID=34168 RepID=A0ACC2D4F8_DIPCM|nr:hypothetical protein O6H91_07G040200 [Diphasiastrum complanatum]
MDFLSVVNERDDSNKGLESTLLGRYYFSRSICHPLHTSLIPTLVFSPRSKPSSDSDSQSRFISIKRSSFPENSSTNLHPMLSKKGKTSPSGHLSFHSSDKGYCSTSPLTSPNLKSSPSCLFFNSSDDSLCLSMEEDRKTQHSRAASWSEYFNNSGGEKAVEVAESWMVDMSELFLGHRFASGAYSRLYHGIYKGQEVAVKLLRQPDKVKEIAQRLDRQFIQEVTLLSRLHHQNVVRFVAACRKPPVCCVITEYLPNGSLRAFLHKNEAHSLPLKIILGMSLDIARGMEYVHSQGVIHRDLKSENLCLEKDLCIKITDFGVACLATECNNLAKDIGTYRWMAPEMISHKPYSRKVDVYSFGIILWELNTGLIPFEEMSAVQAAFAVVDKIVKELEQFEDLSKQDTSFSTWQYPSHRTNLFLRCFTGST